MSVSSHAASEGTAPANFYADSGAWAMDPPEPEPVFEAYVEDDHLVIYPADDPDTWIAAKHPVKIEQ